MMTLLKKAVWVGLGVTERAKEIVGDFSKKGEANQSDGAKRVKSLLEFGEQIEGECNQKIGDLFKRATSCFRIPSWDDMERLEKKLSDLADLVRGRGKSGTEGFASPSPEEAAAPHGGSRGEGKQKSR